MLDHTKSALFQTKVRETSKTFSLKRHVPDVQMISCSANLKDFSSLKFLLVAYFGSILILNKQPLIKTFYG